MEKRLRHTAAQVDEAVDRSVRNEEALGELGPKVDGIQKHSTTLNVTGSAKNIAENISFESGKNYEISISVDRQHTSSLYLNLRNESDASKVYKPIPAGDTSVTFSFYPTESFVGKITVESSAPASNVKFSVSINSFDGLEQRVSAMETITDKSSEDLNVLKNVLTGINIINVTKNLQNSETLFFGELVFDADREYNLSIEISASHPSSVYCFLRDETGIQKAYKSIPSGNVLTEMSIDVKDSFVGGIYMSSPTKGIVDVKLTIDFGNGLTKRVAEAEGKIKEIEVKIPSDIDLSKFVFSKNYLSNNCVWNESNTGTHIVLPVSAFDTFEIKSNDTNQTNYAFLRTYNSTTGNADSPDKIRRTIAASQSSTITIPYGVNYLYIQRTTSGGASMLPSQIKKLDGSYSLKRDILSDVLCSKFIDIEYSALSLCPPNSEAHFRKGIELGFNALKADMRLTKDGEIVLCHDKGFTFDDNSRITTFDKGNCTEIRDLSLDQIKELEFAMQVDGQYVHPCTLDKFLQLCKVNGIIPYLTLREDYIDETAAKSYETIKKYGLLGRAIYNLYPNVADTSAALNKIDPNIIKCNTLFNDKLGGFGFEAIVESVNCGCNFVCIWGTQKDDLTDENVEYAIQNNVKIMSLYGTSSDCSELMELGVVGVQNYTYIPVML